MEIEIDYNPTSRKEAFFISLALNNADAISFDYTTKGHRIMKQVLIESGKITEKKRKINSDGEWDTIVLNNGKFVEKYHVVWYDYDEKDLVNDELWEIVWTKPITKKVKDKLLFYSRLISDNYKNLNKFKKELKEFENFISNQIVKLRTKEIILKEIRFDLKKEVDKKYRKDNEKYFKEKIAQYGVRTPYVRTVASKYFKVISKWKKRDIFNICEDLIKTDYNEETTIAIQWLASLKELWEQKDFVLFEKWIGKYLKNWGKIDDFCLSILSHFIVKFPQFKERVKEWAFSKNKWKRRASAVAFIRGGSWKIYKKYLKDVFDVAKILMNDEEDVVQKGCGWTLKVASETFQRDVFNFIMSNKNKMARVVLRYAIEKMPLNLRKKAIGR